MVSTIVVALGVAVLLAALILFVLKAIRRRRSESILRRRSHYVDLVGELIIRGTVRHRLFRLRSSDSLFRSVVLEYLRLLEGAEREKLLLAARDMGMVERYSQDLRSRDRQVRVTAAQALGEIADPTTLEDLVFALADPIPEVGAQAASALARIGDPRAVGSMLSAMDRHEPWNAQRVADSLLSFGTEAVPEMVRYLQGPGRYRPIIARTLGLIGDLRAEPALIDALSSSWFELRLRAVSALGKVGTIEAVSHLVAALGDERWEVRAQAANALGRRRDQEGIPALTQSLSDESWWVRQNSAAALAEIPGGEQSLRAAIEHDDPYARDAAASVLLTCPVTTEAIEGATSEDPLRRSFAQDLIGALLEAGKTDYFVAAGLDLQTLEEIRLRRSDPDVVVLSSRRPVEAPAVPESRAEESPARSACKRRVRPADAEYETIEVSSFGDAQSLADWIMQGVPVRLDLTPAGPEMMQRLVDFASGLTYSAGGALRKISDRIVLVLPPGHSEAVQDEAPSAGEAT